MLPEALTTAVSRVTVPAGPDGPDGPDGPAAPARSGRAFRPREASQAPRASGYLALLEVDREQRAVLHLRRRDGVAFQLWRADAEERDIADRRDARSGERRQQCDRRDDERRRRPVLAKEAHERITLSVVGTTSDTYPDNGFLYRPAKSFRNVYIRKMPNVVSRIGAFSAAEMPSASTRLVSSGSMMPSSQSRAVE